MNNLELSNIGGLDESICNAVGIDNNEYSNEYSNMINEDLLDGLTENTSLLSANGEEYSYMTITPEQAQQAAQVAKAGIGIAQSLAPKADSDGCKKPALTESFLNRGKWSRYKDCLRDAKASKQAASKAEQDRLNLQQQQQQMQMQMQQQSQQSQQRGSSDDGGDKFLGMPKAVGITVTVVGALALIVGGIFLVKKLRKK